MVKPFSEGGAGFIKLPAHSCNMGALTGHEKTEFAGFLRWYFTAIKFLLYCSNIRNVSVENCSPELVPVGVKNEV